MRARLTCKERDDILVSYLTGLGPVGMPVICTATWVRSDLKWDYQTYYNGLRNLIKSRRVRRFHVGQYIVLKPLEAGRRVLDNAAILQNWKEAA